MQRASGATPGMEAAKRLFGLGVLALLLAALPAVAIAAPDAAGLKLLREALTAEGVRLRYLDGSTPAEQRGREVAAFQALAGEEGAEGGRSGKKKKKAAHVVF